MKIKFKAFKKILEDKSKWEFIVSRILSNIDSSQKYVIRYRATFVLYSILYILALIDHLNLEIFNQYLIISPNNPFLSLDNIENMILAFAPSIFSILLYLIFLAKFHRGILHEILNIYIKKDEFIFLTLNTFSSGHVRKFFRSIKKELKAHNFNKYAELIYYWFITLTAAFIPFFNPSNIILHIIMSLFTLTMVYIIFRDLKIYKQVKHEIVDNL